MPEEEIIARIVAAMPGAEVTLEDLTGGANHWRAVVVSSSFDGVPQVRRHRMVYKALRRGHAWAHSRPRTGETFTPGESAAG